MTVLENMQQLSNRRCLGTWACIAIDAHASLWFQTQPSWDDTAEKQLGKFTKRLSSKQGALCPCPSALLSSHEPTSQTEHFVGIFNILDDECSRLNSFARYKIDVKRFLIYHNIMFRI